MNDNSGNLRIWRVDAQKLAVWIIELFLIIAIVLPLLTLTRIIDSENSPSFWATFIGSCIAIANALLLYATLKSQNESIINAKDAHRQERFETTFFNLLDLQRKLRNEMAINYEDLDWRGNIHNKEAHYYVTAEEILKDTEGKIDIFIAGVGTGGTVTGVGKRLKEYNLNIKIVAVEPFDSPFLSENRAGAHKIQGIGAGFKPDILDLSVVDEIITVKNDDAMDTAKLLARKEGILAGISAGANMFAAINFANENKDKTIVTVLPDTGERYLSTGVFS